MTNYMNNPPAVIHQQSTPRQLPADFTLSGQKLPLREGRIHFMRRVSPQGQVRVLNVDWNVPRFDPLKGVWVTIEFRTMGALLSPSLMLPPIHASETVWRLMISPSMNRYCPLRTLLTQKPKRTRHTLKIFDHSKLPNRYR